MTEQEKSSAVVEETREAVETTSQPVNTEKKSKNSTALILSAVAIAIALAAGVGLGFRRHDAGVGGTHGEPVWVGQLRARHGLDRAPGDALCPPRLPPRRPTVRSVWRLQADLVCFQRLSCGGRRLADPTACQSAAIRLLISAPLRRAEIRIARVLAILAATFTKGKPAT